MQASGGAGEPRTRRLRTPSHLEKKGRWGHMIRCVACGKFYGRTEMVMVNVTGLKGEDALCPSCERVWNDLADSLDAESAALIEQRYEEFKKERRVG